MPQGGGRGGGGILTPTAVQPASTAKHVANKRITVQDKTAGKDKQEETTGGGA